MFEEKWSLSSCSAVSEIIFKLTNKIKDQFQIINHVRLAANKKQNFVYLVTEWCDLRPNQEAKVWWSLHWVQKRQFLRVYTWTKSTQFPNSFMLQAVFLQAQFSVSLKKCPPLKNRQSFVFKKFWWTCRQVLRLQISATVHYLHCGDRFLSTSGPFSVLLLFLDLSVEVPRTPAVS